MDRYIQTGSLDLTDNKIALIISDRMKNESCEWYGQLTNGDIETTTASHGSSSYASYITRAIGPGSCTSSLTCT